MKSQYTSPGNIRLKNSFKFFYLKWWRMAPNKYKCSQNSNLTCKQFITSLQALISISMCLVCCYNVISQDECLNPTGPHQSPKFFIFIGSFCSLGTRTLIFVVINQLFVFTQETRLDLKLMNERENAFLSYKNLSLC